MDLNNYREDPSNTNSKICGFRNLNLGKLRDYKGSVKISGQKHIAMRN